MFLTGRCCEVARLRLEDIDSYIAYDRRLLDAAEASGVRTEQPG
jgi:hypothetical protein